MYRSSNFKGLDICQTHEFYDPAFADLLNGLFRFNNGANNTAHRLPSRHLFNRLGRFSGLSVSAFVFASFLPGIGFAADRGFIWSPTKLSGTAYSARIGLTAPDNPGTSAGVRIGVTSDTVGGPVHAPLAFWGKIATASSKISALQQRQELNFEYQASTGEAILRITERTKQIYSGSCDLDLYRNISLSYSDGERERVLPFLDHTLKFSHPASGTAIGFQVSTAGGFHRLNPTLTLEKHLGPRLNFTGVLAGAGFARPYAGIHGRYSVRW